MVYKVTDQERRDEEIWIDPSIPLGSVAKLVQLPDFNSKRDIKKKGHEAIPAPRGLTTKSRELKKLRSTSVWKKGGNRDDQVDQMDFWFPDLPTRTSPSHKKAKLQPTSVQTKAKLQKLPTFFPGQNEPCPTSDIGTLTKLPGEIRNRIYRLALLSPQPILVTMPYRTCGTGRCLHDQIGYNAPGIAQACKQLRWEALPIYLAEHPAIQFDAGTTREGCTKQVLKRFDHYADLIPKFTFLLERPIWKLDAFLHYATYHFSITTPKWDGSGEYSLEQWESAGRKICQCSLEKLVVGLNEKRKMDKPTGKAMLEFLDEDDFSDFIWRVKKTKQWPQHLARCPKCKEVVFNS